MLIKITRDEWYPVFDFEKANTKGYGQTLEVVDKIVNRWKASKKAFLIAQKEMETLYVKGQAR